MINIAIIDDVESNVDLMKLLVEEWFEENNIGIDKYSLHYGYSGYEALEIIDKIDCDILFLDIMMPVMDGFDTLRHLRKLDKAKHLKKIMVTALADSSMKEKSKSLGANAYVTKPVDARMIYAMLNNYINKEDFVADDDFFDFDDFETENISSSNDTLMDSFNQSHKHVSALEYLKDYPNLDYILEDIEDINIALHPILVYMDGVNLVNEMDNIIHMLDRYARFLNTFSDFYELSTSLVLLGNVIKKINLNTLDESSKEMISNFVIAILKDLDNWKEHVFIKQDAVDVFYINASSLNSCIQLESYIKKKC